MITDPQSTEVAVVALFVWTMKLKGTRILRLKQGDVTTHNFLIL